jgi:DNA polymerase-3 subunit alpha
MFTLEDYEETHEFRMFGEDYLKFRHFLVPNTFLHCKIKVQQGWIDKNTGRPRDPRVIFTQMQQLQDVMAVATKKLSIDLHVSEIQEKKVASLKDMLEQHKGDHHLSFNIKDHDEKISIDMSSRLQKVNVTADLLKLLDEAGINYGVS